MIRQCPNCSARNRVPARHLADSGRCGACGSSLPPLATPIDADAALFDEITREAQVPVLVDFWAPWCGPCRMAAPEVAKAAAKLAGRALVLKVNTESEPTLSARYGIRSIPHFAVFVDGRPRSQQSGLLSQQHLQQLALGAIG